MKAVLAGSPGASKTPSLWARIWSFDLERRLALVLTFIAVVAGLATYWMTSRRPPYGANTDTVQFLLNLDLLLLLLLAIVLVRRVVLLI